jgi:hypothetical protein
MAGHARWGGCVPAPRAIALLPPRPCLPTAPRAGRRPSAAGSHLRQRGEGAELRGQAAAQAFLAKVPASEKGHQLGSERGERERVERRGRCGGHGRCEGMGGVRAWEVCGRYRGAGGGVSQVWWELWWGGRGGGPMRGGRCCARASPVRYHPLAESEFCGEERGGEGGGRRTDGCRCWCRRRP